MALTKSHWQVKATGIIGLCRPRSWLKRSLVAYQCMEDIWCYRLCKRGVARLRKMKSIHTPTHITALVFKRKLDKTRARCRAVNLCCRMGRILNSRQRYRISSIGTCRRLDKVCRITLPRNQLGAPYPLMPVPEDNSIAV